MVIPVIRLERHIHIGPIAAVHANVRVVSNLRYALHTPAESIDRFVPHSGIVAVVRPMLLMRFLTPRMYQCAQAICGNGASGTSKRVSGLRHIIASKAIVFLAPEFRSGKSGEVRSYYRLYRFPDGLSQRRMPR